jgi:hypothetical protein
MRIDNEASHSSIPNSIQSAKPSQKDLFRNVIYATNGKQRNQDHNWFQKANPHCHERIAKKDQQIEAIIKRMHQSAQRQ